MKNTKPIYILFFLITLSALDSVAQSPIYLYLKNGVIETFYPELTDSMTVSNIDENGNEYDEPIVQRIYSNDSVYVYNLIDIDSIGLYVPPTILKPGVIDINKELINYVIGSEDLTLTLSDNTPNKIIPHKGDKLVFAAVTDIFPHGFAGEVQSVQTDANGNYNLDCELVTLTDIFEQYYSSSTKKEAVSRYYDYGTIPWKPGTIPIDLELDGIFPIKKLPDVELKAHYHGSFTPDFQIYIEQIISRRDFYSTKVTVVGEYDLGTTLEVAGEISNRDDHRLILWQPNAGIPFISKFFLEAGWIGGGNCKGSLTLNTFARRTFAFSRHWVTIAPQFEGTSNIKQTPPSGRELYGDYSLSGSLEGGFNVGLYLEAGFAFLDKRILSVGVRGEIGCEISGQISITQSGPQMESTEFYDNLKENYIKGELYAKGAFGLDYFEFGKDHEDKKNPHIKWTWMETPPLSYELFNFSLVPSFSKLVVTKNSQYPKYTDIASEVSNISLPASIGYAIKNSKGEIVESSYVAEGWNWGGGVMDKFNLQYTSEALKKGRDYTIYPLVKWNFWPYCEMIASPSSDFSDPLIIITSTSSQILGSSARIHGIIDDYDSSYGIELGFYYGESPIINEKNGTYVASNSENNGVFASDLRNLKPETKYYYRACAIIDGEVVFADNTQSFTTEKEEEINPSNSITIKIEPLSPIKVTIGAIGWDSGFQRFYEGKYLVSFENLGERILLLQNIIDNNYNRHMWEFDINTERLIDSINNSVVINVRFDDIQTDPLPWQNNTTNWIATLPQNLTFQYTSSNDGFDQWYSDLNINFELIYNHNPIINDFKISDYGSETKCIGFNLNGVHWIKEMVCYYSFPDEDWIADYTTSAYWLKDGTADSGPRADNKIDFCNVFYNDILSKNRKIILIVTWANKDSSIFEFYYDYLNGQPLNVIFPQ